MELFLLRQLALGDLEIVIDTGLMDIRVSLTVLGVEVRLRLVRAITETKFFIIILRTRSMLKVRVRSIAVLEARANMNMSGTVSEMVRMALMTVVLVVSTISSWLNIVVNRSVVLIMFLVLLAISVMEVLLSISGVMGDMVVLLSIRSVLETKLVLSEAATDKAMETTEAIA